jgi:hypothetical protein
MGRARRFGRTKPNGRSPLKTRPYPRQPSRSIRAPSARRRPRQARCPWVRRIRCGDLRRLYNWNDALRRPCLQPLLKAIGDAMQDAAADRLREPHIFLALALAHLTCLSIAVAVTVNCQLYQDLSDAHSSASSRRPIAVQGPAAAAVFGLARESCSARKIPCAFPAWGKKIPCFSALGNLPRRTSEIQKFSPYPTSKSRPASASSTNPIWLACI